MNRDDHLVPDFPEPLASEASRNTASWPSAKRLVFRISRAAATRCVSADRGCLVMRDLFSSFALARHLRRRPVPGVGPGGIIGTRTLQ